MQPFVLFIGDQRCATSGFNPDLDKSLHVEAIEKNDTSKVRSLLNNCADPNAYDDWNMESAIIKAIHKGNFEIVKMLVSHGANLESENESNHALIAAVYAGDIRIIKFLIKSGANVNIENRWGGTPLQSAIYSGRLDIIELLIANGVNTNHIDKEHPQNETPLMLAAKEGKYQVFKALVEKGKADPYIKNKNNEDALFIAIKNKQQNIVDYLQGKVLHASPKLKNTPELINASLNGNLLQVNDLLVRGANVNSVDEQGKTAVSYAVENGHFKVVEHLVLSEADVHPKDVVNAIDKGWSIGGC